MSGRKYRLSLDIPTYLLVVHLHIDIQVALLYLLTSSDIQDGKFTTEFTMPSNDYFWLQTTGSYTD